MAEELSKLIHYNRRCSVKGLFTKKERTKATKAGSSQTKDTELERDNEKLRHKLKRAEMLVDF